MHVIQIQKKIMLLTSVNKTDPSQSQFSLALLTESTCLIHNIDPFESQDRPPSLTGCFVSH